MQLHTLEKAATFRGGRAHSAILPRHAPTGKTFQVGGEVSFASPVLSEVEWCQQRAFLSLSRRDDVKRSASMTRGLAGIRPLCRGFLVSVLIQIFFAGRIDNELEPEPAAGDELLAKDPQIVSPR